MMKISNFRWAIVLCGAVAAAACQSASPTAPTTDPEPVTLTGAWSGTATGDFITSDQVTSTLTQTGAAVTGDWSMPMPAVLVAFGAPAQIPLAGPVTGDVTGTTANLVFGFNEAFMSYLGPDCALSVTVSSFTETTMDAMWMTTSCQEPVIDDGTLTMTRQ